MLDPDLIQKFRTFQYEFIDVWSIFETLALFVLFSVLALYHLARKAIKAVCGGKRVVPKQSRLAVPARNSIIKRNTPNERASLQISQAHAYRRLHGDPGIRPPRRARKTPPITSGNPQLSLAFTEPDGTNLEKVEATK